jgi:hypothetical protein
MSKKKNIPYKDLFEAAMSAICWVRWSEKSSFEYDNLIALLKEYEIFCNCGYSGDSLYEANEEAKKRRSWSGVKMVKRVK